MLTLLMHFTCYLTAQDSVQHKFRIDEFAGKLIDDSLDIGRYLICRKSTPKIVNADHEQDGIGIKPNNGVQTIQDTF